MNLELNYQKLNFPYLSISSNYAAVSILIFKENEILYIKRTEEMSTHKGQIAFPGGKKENEDKNVVETAVREATEEILLSPSFIVPIGLLEPIDTIEYKFNVYPVICNLLQKPQRFNKEEVQDIFFVDIKELSNSANWNYRGNYTDDWIFMIRDEILWGATAKVTRKLLNLNLR